MAQDVEQTTDTHLAKKYNDALFDLIMRCNYLGFVNKSAPHFENLQAYYAATEMFFSNTFFLFEQINITTNDGQVNLSKKLMQLQREVEEDIRNIKTYSQYRTRKHFHDVSVKISYMHKLIMFGLQQRQMLVRMSEREPTGSESIKYWDDKVGFREGGLDLKKNQS